MSSYDFNYVSSTILLIGQANIRQILHIGSMRQTSSPSKPDMDVLNFLEKIGLTIKELARRSNGISDTTARRILLRQKDGRQHFSKATEDRVWSELEKEAKLRLTEIPSALNIIKQYRRAA